MDGRAQGALDLRGHRGCDSNLDPGPFVLLNLGDVGAITLIGAGVTRHSNSYALHAASGKSPFSFTRIIADRIHQFLAALAAVTVLRSLRVCHICIHAVQDPRQQPRQCGASSGCNSHRCNGVTVAVVLTPSD